MSTVAVAVACWVIAFAAAAYGGVEPWSELLLVLASGLALAIALVECIRHGLSRPVATVLAICGAIGLLAWFQSVTLPSSWVEFLSPTRHATVAGLLDPVPGSLSLSYNAADTRQSLRLLLIGIAVFAATATAVRDKASASWLLFGVFAIGVGESVLSLTQQATGATGIYWGSVTAGEVRSGSFVNHSNFSQFLNVTLGASVALFLIRLSEDRRERRPIEAENSAHRGVFRHHGWLVIGIAVQTLAVAASLSRAGVLAMFSASVIALMVLPRKRSVGKLVWLLAGVPVVGLFGLAWLGFFDAFLDRIETLSGDAPLSDRVALGLATIRVGLNHWLTGAGLGAHASVFPAYDTTNAVAFAEQADNDYAQLFEEMGIPGCLLVAGLLVALAQSTLRLLKREGESTRYLAVGFTYAFVAVAIQSLTDFGLRLPAVMGSVATLAGAVVGVSTTTTRAVSGTSPRRMGTAIAAAVLLAGVWTGAVVGSVAEYRAERWWSLAYELNERVAFAGPLAEPQDYVDMVAAAETAVRLKPDRPKYAFWLNAYRWQAVEFARRAGADPAGSPGKQAKAATAIADELAAVRRLGPTFGPAYTLEGQLRAVADSPSAAELVESGVRLSPNDPVACLAAATQRLAQPTNDATDPDAYRLLSRAVGLDNAFYLEAAQLVVRERGDVVFAIELARQNPNRLGALAKWVQTLDGDFTAALQTIQSRIEVAELAFVRSGRASPSEVAAFARRLAGRGRHEEAVEHYQAALAADFSQSPWRLAMADSLVVLGRLEEAAREAAVCVRQQPRSAEARLRLTAIEEKIRTESVPR